MLSVVQVGAILIAALSPLVFPWRQAAYGRAR